MFWNIINLFIAYCILYMLFILFVNKGFQLLYLTSLIGFPELTRRRLVTDCVYILTRTAFGLAAPKCLRRPAFPRVKHDEPQRLQIELRNVRPFAGRACGGRRSAGYHCVRIARQNGQDLECRRVIRLLYGWLIRTEKLI